MTRDYFREGDQFRSNGRNFQVETIDRNSECPTRLFVREIKTGLDGRLRLGDRYIMSPDAVYQSEGRIWTDRQRELYHRDRDFGPNRRPLNITEQRELKTGIPDPNDVAMRQRMQQQRYGR